MAARASWALRPGGCGTDGMKLAWIITRIGRRESQAKQASNSGTRGDKHEPRVAGSGVRRATATRSEIGSVEWLDAHGNLFMTIFVIRVHRRATAARISYTRDLNKPGIHFRVFNPEGGQIHRVGFLKVSDNVVETRNLASFHDFGKWLRKDSKVAKARAVYPL